MTFEPLTEREADVLVLIARGRTNRQIADELALAKSTVRWYARQIYAKLGVEDRQQAVAYALELGLVAEVEPPPLPRNNIPGSATPFVGRHRSLARLDKLLRDPTIRLITIVGPGGIGKTRLALAAAERQLRPLANAGGALSYRFPDGVWFIPLAAIHNAGRLVPAISGALDLHLDAGGGRNLEGLLLDFLRLKRALLVLDNFEQLVDTAHLLPELIATAPGVQLLVTSRERLQLHGEQIFSIEGLAVPENVSGGLSTLGSYDSVQLFLNIARRVQPEIEFAEADGPHLSRICQAVAGSPLAIELAASWVSALPLREIADEIERSLDLLAADMRDVPSRHRSIQAALDVSWQRLSPEQQDAFLRLSVFRGSFTRQAAHQVARAALPLLVQLVYKSWLVYDQKADRYRIHELLRQYGLQRLASRSRLEAETSTAYAAYYFSFLKEREADFHRSRQAVAVQEIQVEVDGIWQAWEWAVSQPDATLIEQGLNSLCRFLFWTGRISDGESACRTAAEQLELLDTDEAAPEHLVLRARILAWQSRFSTVAEVKAQLLSQCEKLVERATAAGVEIRAERAFLQLRRAENAEESDINVAFKHYEEALALFRSLHNRSGIAEALLGLSNVMFRLGRLDGAEAYARESLAILDQLDDRLVKADAQNMLALIYKHQQLPEKAELLQREIMQLYQALHHPLREINEAGNLANTLWWLGRFDEMLEVAEHAISIQDDLGIEQDPFLANTAACALLHLGRYHEARLLSENALALARATGSQFTGFTLLYLGQIAVTEGALDEAVNWLSEATESMGVLWPNRAAESLACLAYVWLKGGKLRAADDKLDEALRWSSEVRSYVSCQYCLPVAALLLARRHAERAIELYGLSQTFDHLARSRWFMDTAGRELEQIASELPPHVAEAARARGRELDIWSTATELLEELRAERLDRPV